MISLKSLTLRRGARVLLERVSAAVNPGEKVGLVGRNGAGKSSLFALFAGRLREDGGEFSMPPGWRVAEVSQDMPETPESATAFVIAGDAPLAAARAELAAAEASGDGERLARAYMALHDAGANDAEARAQALILGLGFKPSELDAPVDTFSGGWRMRLQLARALMCPSDLLLLDEPTNHLDLDALVWLEGWLRRYAGTLIVVSHDREFLDAVTQVTLHIEHGALTRYAGNYSAFEEIRAQRLELQQSAYLKQQEKIARLQKFIDRFRAKATKARQAQSRLKALERMERLAPALAAADFGFRFREPASLPNPMFALRGVDCGYPAPGDGPPAIILRQVSRTVAAGQRVGILGANGQGKSTLVKTIAGALAPLGGAVTPGKGLSVGYFAQRELDVLRPNEGALEHLRRLARDAPNEAGREQELRDFLGAFGFAGDAVAQRVGTLSGGEKARLVLALIVWQRPNLLLLDEPTNHLDLPTREALRLALNEFDGAVLLVSHDRALLRAVCDEFWLVADGRLAPFDGDLDDYQQFLRDEARRQREQTRAARRDEKPPAASAARRAGPSPSTLKRRLAEVEQRLAELEKTRADLEARLGQTRAPEELARIGSALQSATAALAAAEEDWLRLTEQLDAL
ncbi:MAG: ATP-binding cassette domain-containing protein [Candidatus Accumulibacter sp.]|jgi:ATP-binding cassette subfamily F protein 3|nr:ATP-binding cassette domain-containing protein [Accumulibacter sp.]